MGKFKKKIEDFGKKMPKARSTKLPSPTFKKGGLGKRFAKEVVKFGEYRVPKQLRK